MSKKRHFIVIPAKALAALCLVLSLGAIGSYISVVEPTKPIEPVTEDIVTFDPVPTPGTVVATDDNSGPQATIASNIIPTIPRTVAANEPFEPDIIDTPADRYVTIDDKEYPLREYSTAALPNDPLADQWWVQQTNLPDAWGIPQGANETILAVIDGGFALDHQEFSGRILENTSEFGPAESEAPSQLNCTDRGLPINTSCNLLDDDLDGIVDNESSIATIYENISQLNCTDQGMPLTKDCNLIDDDNNGYVDDYRGFDFINDDRSTQTGENNPLGSGVEHGTAVASVAAGTGNNSVGIAGVDWATKILPIQAIDDDDYGTTLSVGRAIYYAVERRADVINLSLGGSGNDPFVREAVQAAIRSGAVVVAASGNDGCDCVSYPARYPEVVAVGALTESLQRASFSSYGSSLDLMAPGTNFTAAGWSSANQSARYISGINGTSFSTPLVSGLLTRIKSQQPNATPLQLQAALTEHVNRLGLPLSTARSNTIGFGTMNAFGSTSRMADPRSDVQLDTLVRVQTGTYLNTSTPREQSGDYVATACMQRPATTPLYELTKTGDRFFTISYSEVVQAVSAGYTASLFAYSCLMQPHDTAQTIREIDAFVEFRNTYPKYRFTFP